MLESLHLHRDFGMQVHILEIENSVDSRLSQIIVFLYQAVGHRQVNANRQISKIQPSKS